ncbi:MAG TPA: hypothetical protein VM680_19135 [Verrucomicrobiae bacterium]|nr:hypothetical protein [Verrucomicrobiae bacterium]
MTRLVVWFFAASFLLFSSLEASAVDEARLQAVEASVQIQESPAAIRMVWANPERPAARYKISRRTGNDGWSEVATVGGSETGWTDSNVAASQRYEYRIIKETNDGYLGHAYLAAGIRASMLEDTGKVLLLVRDNIAGAIGGELEQFRKDLIAEGWEVLRQDISGGATPPQVRAAIQAVYNNTGGSLRQVILVGHIAVAYSGNIMPDGHANHKGAWPADGYYADVNGTWTDSSVNTKTAERESNWNVPGDGKFDQGEYPAELKLAVGRIDFSDMTCYANKANARSEVDLTRQYFNKNHAYRMGQWQIARRGLVLDNFGLRDTNGVSASAWANFAAYFGASANSRMDLNTYFSRLTSETALWTWSAGGGSYYYSSGVGTSDDFALKDVNVVFFLSLGSYFGDWNNESNWLRAALGSGKILASVYSGIPRGNFHKMALGGTIGESFLITQNNNFSDGYLPDTQGTHEVHQALLGDPTLRMSQYRGAMWFSGHADPGVAVLNWTRTYEDPSYVGAHVYRATSADGPFVRITANPLAGDSYTDRSAPLGAYWYMLRGVYNEQSGSGTFQNLGRGSFTDRIQIASGNPDPDPDPTPTGNPPKMAIRRASGNTIGLSITADANKTVTVETSDALPTWTPLGTITATGSAQEFELQIDSNKQRIYRARY